MKYSKSISTLLLSASLLGAACASAPKEVSPGKAKTPATSTIASSHGGTAKNPGAAPATPDPTPLTNVKWTPPARWKVGHERAMRAATYLIPAAVGDKEEAECAVFVNIGGSVQANLDRWVGQFEQPDGVASKGKATTKQETINGLPVTIIDVSGNYKGGGVAMGQPSPPKPGFRLLGAIAEAPSGPVYFKLIGPAKTVTVAQNEFQTMLQSLK